MANRAAHVCDTGRQIGLAGCLGQSLIQVGHQVIGVLYSDRQTHDAWACACGFLLLKRQLAVRGAGRVDDQAARIAKVGNVAEDLKVINKFDTGIVPAFDRDSEQSTGALGANLWDQIVIRRRR